MWHERFFSIIKCLVSGLCRDVTELVRRSEPFTFMSWSMVLGHLNLTGLSILLTVYILLCVMWFVYWLFNLSFLPFWQSCTYCYLFDMICVSVCKWEGGKLILKHSFKIQTRVFLYHVILIKHMMACPHLHQDSPQINMPLQEKTTTTHRHTKKLPSCLLHCPCQYPMWVLCRCESHMHENVHHFRQFATASPLVQTTCHDLLTV